MNNRVLTSLLLVNGLASACADSTYLPLEDVATSHAMGAQDEMAEVVAILPKATLQEFHDAKANGAGYADFEAEAKAASGFQHVGVNYNAHGHGPPGVNDIPHVDAHFYLISMAEREAITCDGETVPEAAKVPEGVDVNANKEPFGGCVPAMGAHGALPYDKLTADMIYGYSGGELAFIEPMVDAQKLFDEEEIELDILQPAEVPGMTVYPTRFFMRYTDDNYEFVLTDFVDVE